MSYNPKRIRIFSVSLKQAGNKDYYRYYFDVYKNMLNEKFDMFVFITRKNTEFEIPIVFYDKTEEELFLAVEEILKEHKKFASVINQKLPSNNLKNSEKTLKSFWKKVKNKLSKEIDETIKNFNKDKVIKINKLKNNNYDITFNDKTLFVLNIKFFITLSCIEIRFYLNNSSQDDLIKSYKYRVTFDQYNKNSIIKDFFASMLKTIVVGLEVYKNIK